MVKSEERLQPILSLENIILQENGVMEVVEEVEEEAGYDSVRLRRKDLDQAPHSLFSALDSLYVSLGKPPHPRYGKIYLCALVNLFESLVNNTMVTTTITSARVCSTLVNLLEFAKKYIYLECKYLHSSKYF